jgi:hypothetical protein
MRALIATLAFAFVAAQPAFAQKPPPPEQVAPTDYTEEWRRNFVAGCTDEALRIEICECALRNIERVVPYAESHALDRAAAAGRSPDPRTLETYHSIVFSCMSALDA